MRNHAGMCICECSWLPNEEALVEVSGLRGPWIERSPFTIAKSYGLRPTASSLCGGQRKEEVLVEEVSGPVVPPHFG